MNRWKLLLTICLLSVRAASAWELMPLDRLIAESDVVLIGRLATVMRGDAGPDSTDHGYLRAQELLKGQLPDGQGVVLSFPGRRGSYGADGSFHSTLSSEDLRFEEGVEACWFLKRVPGSDSYSVDHPSRFAPYPLYDGIRAAIAGKAKAQAVIAAKPSVAPKR